jgi:hypothetical protein
MSRSSADNSRTASANSTINLLCSSEYCSSSLKDEGGRGLDLTLRGGELQSASEASLRADFATD